MIKDFKELLSIFNESKVLPEISGVDFDGAWARRVAVIIDTDSGLTADFIAHTDLIEAKLQAGRPQDIADVAAIKAAKALD